MVCEESPEIKYSDLTEEQHYLLHLGPHRQRDLAEMTWKDKTALNAAIEEARVHLNTRGLAGQSLDMLSTIGAAEHVLSTVATREAAEILWKNMRVTGVLSLFHTCRLVYKYKIDYDEIKNLRKTAAAELLVELDKEVWQSTPPIQPPPPPTTVAPMTGQVRDGRGGGSTEDAGGEEPCSQKNTNSA